MLLNLKKRYLIHKKYFFVLFFLILFILFAKVIQANNQIIIESINLAFGAQKRWILFSLFVYLLIIPLNSLILFILSYTKLSLILTLRQQAALLFVNKVLPLSLGQIAFNSYYLHKEGNSKVQIVSIFTAKGLSSALGLVVVLILFLIVNIEKIIYYSKIINPLFNSFVIMFAFIVIFIFLLLILLFFINTKIKINNKISKWVLTYKKEILKFKKKPFNLIMSTLISIGIIFVGILALMLSAKAVGVNLSYSESFFIFYIGIIIATLIPIPGGIGATEIGLYFGFYILGFDPLLFISAILIFRLINYWLPLFIGFLFFINLRKNVLKNFTLNYSKNDKIKASFKN